MLKINNQSLQKNLNDNFEGKCFIKDINNYNKLFNITLGVNINYNQFYFENLPLEINRLINDFLTEKFLIKFKLIIIEKNMNLIPIWKLNNVKSYSQLNKYNYFIKYLTNGLILYNFTSKINNRTTKSIDNELVNFISKVFDFNTLHKCMFVFDRIEN